MNVHFNKCKEHTIKAIIKSIPLGAAHLLNVLPTPFTHNALALLLNRIFKDELATDQLDYLQQKWLKLEISDLSYCCFISVNKSAFTVRPQAQTDITFTGAFKYYFTGALKALAKNKPLDNTLALPNQYPRKASTSVVAITRPAP